MTNITDNQANAIVTDLLNKSIKRLKQEVIGENEEFLDRLLRQYCAKVTRQTCKISQKWSKWTDDGPVLMPDNTRLYYRKGRTEILVQEFAPQVRLMKFSGTLAKRQNSTAEIDRGYSGDKIYHYSLALPYMIFLFKFVDGMFNRVQCAFCDRPIKRLEERPLRPYLSNINSDLSVCLGVFDTPALEEGKLTQQVALVLDHFWQSAYKDEWATHFWGSRGHFQKTDPRLATLESWQAASIENPLFVVEDVDWLKHEQDSFGDMIVRALADEVDSKQFHEDLYKDLVDNFLTELKKTFQENLNSAEQKIIAQTNQFVTDLKNLI